MTMKRRIDRAEKTKGNFGDSPTVVVLLDATPDRPPGRVLDKTGHRLTITTQEGEAPKLPPGSGFKVYQGVDIDRV